MGTPANDWTTVRDSVLPIVREAARRISGHSGDLGVREKAPRDYVTRLDEELQRYIQEALGEAFPEHVVVGEENFRALATTSGLIWVVDPLDGTSNFIAGLPFRSVSLALLHDGAPVVGIICDPGHGEMFDGTLGAGARLNGAPLRLGDTEPRGAAVGISSGFLWWNEELPNRGVLQELLNGFGKVRTLGSQALQLCYVAAGRLVANVSREAKLWDDAAGALIVKEAGGWYGDFDGREIFPVPEGSPATKGDELHSIAATPGAKRKILEIFKRF